MGYQRVNDRSKAYQIYLNRVYGKVNHADVVALRQRMAGESQQQVIGEDMPMQTATVDPVLIERFNVTKEQFLIWVDESKQATQRDLLDRYLELNKGNPAHLNQIISEMITRTQALQRANPDKFQHSREIPRHWANVDRDGNLIPRHALPTDTGMVYDQPSLRVTSHTSHLGGRVGVIKHIYSTGQCWVEVDGRSVIVRGEWLQSAPTEPAPVVLAPPGSVHGADRCACNRNHCLRESELIPCKTHSSQPRSKTSVSNC